MVLYPYLAPLAKQTLIPILSRITKGRLVLDVKKTGERLEFGDAEAEPVIMTILDENKFWTRLGTAGDMGFADSYLLEEVVGDLFEFFKLIIANKHITRSPPLLSILTTLASSIITSVPFLSHNPENDPETARLNIAAHYDISNEMFAAFLSQDMTYSCPIYANPEDTDLEGAQKRKLERIIHNAGIKTGDDVLEIGSGWGSFAVLAVKSTGCRVLSLTLSERQKEVVERRIEEEGLQGKIEVLLCDYRNLRRILDDRGETGRRFDRVVSIEMLEAVGEKFLDEYFKTVDGLLKTDSGVGVFQCITIPETRQKSYAASNDFIRKYIFPGGYLPSNTQLISAINSGSSGRLIPEAMENIGGHYTFCLKQWCDNFLANFDTKIRTNLAGTEEQKDVFRRKWEYYFKYSAAGFDTKTLNDVIITVGREGNREMYWGEKAVPQINERWI